MTVRVLVAQLVDLESGGGEPDAQGCRAGAPLWGTECHEHCRADGAADDERDQDADRRLCRRDDPNDRGDRHRAPGDLAPRRRHHRRGGSRTCHERSQIGDRREVACDERARRKIGDRRRWCRSIEPVRQPQHHEPTGDTRADDEQRRRSRPSREQPDHGDQGHDQNRELRNADQQIAQRSRHPSEQLDQIGRDVRERCRERSRHGQHEGQQRKPYRQASHVDGVTLPFAPITLAKRGVDGCGHRSSMDHDSGVWLHPGERCSEDDVGLQAPVLTDDRHHA